MVLNWTMHCSCVALWFIMRPRLRQRVTPSPTTNGRHQSIMAHSATPIHEGRCAVIWETRQLDQSTGREKKSTGLD